MPMTNALFDTDLHHKRQSRALKQARTSHDAEFLLDEAIDILRDRFLDIKRTFPIALDIGAHTGQLAKSLQNTPHVGQVISAEAHPEFASQLPQPNMVLHNDTIPLDDESVDLVMSCMSLQWVNDLPLLLKEAFRVLKPGGLLLATLPGEDTLHELRESFARAELEEDGGVSPRVIPMLTIKDAGSLMQTAGYENPIVDRDRITVDYSDPLKLMHDLQNMGETNALLSRKKAPLRRRTLMAMIEMYHELHTTPEGRYLASFELVTLTGWKRESI